MSSRFKILSEKYIAGNITDTELDELDKLLEEDASLKEELAQLLIQDIAIENTIQVSKHLKKVDRIDKTNKSGVFIKFILAASFVLACLGSYYYFVNAKYTIARVNELVGSGSVIRGDQTLKISKDLEILKGDRVELNERSYLVIKSPGNSLIELDECTNLLFSGKEIEVKKGRIYTNIAKNDKRFFQYTCPNNSKLNILGTSFEWQYNSYNNSSILRVKEGVVKLSRDIQGEIVTANQGWFVPAQGKFVPILEKYDAGQWRTNQELFRDNGIYVSQLFKDKYFLNFWEHEITGEGSIDWSSEIYKSNLAIHCKDKEGSVLIRTPYIQPLGKDLFFELESHPIDFSGKVEYGYYLYINNNIHSKIGIQASKNPKTGFVEMTHIGLDYSKPEGDPKREEVIKQQTKGEIKLFFNGKFLSDKSIKMKKNETKEVKDDDLLLFNFSLQSGGNKFCLVMYAKVLSEKGHITVPLKYMHATTTMDKLAELKNNTGN